MRKERKGKQKREKERKKEKFFFLIAERNCGCEEESVLESEGLRVT